MKATEYVDIAEEINRCLENAKYELKKVNEALNAYKLDYGINDELDAIYEAIQGCKVTENLNDYEDDDLFESKRIKD